MGASLGLLITGDPARRIIEYSQYMCSMQKSEVLLSAERALPHVTLLKTHDSAEITVDQAIHAVGSLIGRRVSLTFAGLNLIPSRSGGVWVEIQVLKTKSLVQLHDELVHAGIFESGWIESAVGDEFRAHITVARFPQPLAFVPDMPLSVLRMANVESFLTVGSAGNTFELTNSVNFDPK
jgi:2'-5' RNA ligase